MLPLSFPLSSVDARSGRCWLSVPFGRYQIRLYNPTLSGLGQVSHFLLSAARQYQRPLQQLLPQLGLDALQAEGVMRRLTQLKLLNDDSSLTGPGTIAADFLALQLQDAAAPLWIEQLDLPFNKDQLPQIRFNDQELFAPASPDDGVLLPHLTGFNSGKQQEMVLEQVLRPNRIGWLKQRFPALEQFTGNLQDFPLSVSLIWDRQIAYQPLPVAMPGRDPLWQALPDHGKDKNSVQVCWPMMRAQRTYFDPVSGQTRAEEHLCGCRFTGDPLPDAVQHDAPDGQAPAEKEQRLWLEQLQKVLPDESPALQLCNRQLRVQPQVSYWQADLLQVRRQLNTARHGAPTTTPA